MRGLAICVLAPAAFWALRPSSPLLQPDIALDDAPVGPEASPNVSIAQLDPRVFTARLWNPKLPPAPPTPPPAPAQPTKPAVSLVAVIESSGGGGQLQVALYDPADQRVRVFDVGQSLRQYTISKITIEHVILSEGPWSHELRLREERPASPVIKLIDDPTPQARVKP